MSKFIEDEPALTAGAAGAVVSYALSALVTHGVISGTVASALTQQIVPVAAAVLSVALGFLLRHLVTPAAKVKHLLETAGLMTDADFGRLEAMVTDLLEQKLASPAAQTLPLEIAPAVTDVPPANAG